MTVRVVVVGAGISGLAAAHELAGRSGVDVIVLEAGDRAGGKIRTGEVAGARIDLGPDAFLARRPEATTLCEELGLAPALVPPATGEAALWSRGRLRPLPGGLLLGVPTRPMELLRSGVLSPLGALRAAAEPFLSGTPAPAHDVPIGAVVRARLGAEAHARLVDPLLGGINAGDTDRLSIDACAPQVAAAARRSRSLVRGARALAAAPSTGPVFLTLPDGMEAVVAALEARLSAAGVELRTSCPVSALDVDGDRLRLHTPGGDVGADRVILAVPGFAAAPLLTPHVPRTASVLSALAYASVALVVLAYRRRDVPDLRGSGFLVPRAEGRLLTACSFASTKWPHVGDHGTVLVRASVGRAGDERGLDLEDPTLIAAVRAELAEAAGIGAEPVDVHVARWPRSFPQYAPGHLDRMGAARAELDEHLPGVALAGAALGGVGIPACIGSGRAAARQVTGDRPAGRNPVVAP